MPRKIDAGEVLAALGGLLVFVSLFLTWFTGFSGWEAFESLDLVMAALALLVIAAAAASATGWTSGPSARILPWLGGALLVIVVVQIVEPPPSLFSIGGDGEGESFAELIDADPETGAWLALAGAALVLLGGILRAAKISVTISVGGRDVRRRVPAVDRRPAASPEPAVRVDSSSLLEPDQATQAFDPVAKPEER